MINFNICLCILIAYICAYRVYLDTSQVLSQVDIKKIKALKTESLHKIGMSLVSKYDKDIDMLERTLQEEDHKIEGLK